MKKSGIKWIVGLVIFIWACIVLCGYIVTSILNINFLNEQSNQIDKILILSNKATIASNEFLLNAYTDETFAKSGSNQNYISFVQTLDTVSIFLNRFLYQDESQKKTLIGSLESHKNAFLKIADLYKTKGFKDLGVEGKMRSAIHFIEKHPSNIPQEYLLTLRRHEKDFLLRKDLSYVKKFEDDLSKFKTYLENDKKLNSVAKKEVLSQLHYYDDEFHKLVELEEQIGLRADLGLRKDFSKHLIDLENTLQLINNKIKKEKKEASLYINIIVSAIIVVFLILMFAVIFGVRYLNRSVLKPIKELNAIANKIADGNLTINLNTLKKEKFLKDLIQSFVLIIEKIKTTISTIEQVSSRKITENIALTNENDEIGQSINKVINEIKAFDDINSQRNWVNEGVNIFSKLLRQNLEPSILNKKFIAELAKYLNINQASLFLVEQNMLILNATYAYDRNKYLKKEILIGEGLIGQAALDKDIIYLTDIPDNYVNIKSGLGGANPRFVAIVPFVTNEMVVAVLEIASFYVLDEYKIEFIQKVGEIYAAGLININQASITQKLNAELLEQNKLIQIQENEMRQNIEELLATQENLERKNEETKTLIENLKNSLKEKEAQLSQLKLENESLILQIRTIPKNTFSDNFFSN